MKFLLLIFGFVTIGMQNVFAAQINEGIYDFSDNNNDELGLNQDHSFSKGNHSTPKNSFRVERQLNYHQLIPLSDSYNPTEIKCKTITGASGKCMSFLECYPDSQYQKFVTVRQLTLLKFEKWSVNSDGSCSLYTGYGQLITGICCPNRNEEENVENSKEIKNTVGWNLNGFTLGPFFPSLPTFGFFINSATSEKPIVKPEEQSKPVEDSFEIVDKEKSSEKPINKVKKTELSAIGIGGLTGNHPPQNQTSSNGKETKNFNSTSTKNDENKNELPNTVSDDEKKTNSLELPSTHQLGFFNWPPQIPTHPPDHHYPTHPPHSISSFTTTTSSINQLDESSYTTKTTQKPYRPVFRPITTQSTTDQSTLRPSISSPAQCGVRNGAPPDQERIVGGQNAIPNEFPWIVVLFKSGKQFCGGSLIDHEHVLTAAHCVAKMTPWTVATLTANLGDHNIRSSTEVQHVERRIKRLVRHKGFEFSTLHNDIAILTLDEPVKYTRAIQPICLPEDPETMIKTFSGQVATVAGWGSLRENGPQPYILQKVTVNIWPNSECVRKYGRAAPAGIIQSMICAGQAARDSCSGDSGGPLMLSHDNGRWIQVGIVSWGIGCGSGRYPGVYTRVTSFLPWIKKNLK